MGTVSVCALCQREPAVALLREGASDGVCGTCIERMVSRLVALLPLFGRSALVPTRASELDPGDEMPTAPRELMEELLAALKDTEVSAAIDASDVETHLGLALAFREMGLQADALHELAFCLKHARGEQLAEVLDRIFGKGSGFKGDVAALRDALYPA